MGCCACAPPKETKNKKLQEKRESFLKYISNNIVIFSKNSALLFGQLDKLFDKAVTAFAEIKGELKLAEPKELFCDGTLIKQQLTDYNVVEISSIRQTELVSASHDEIPHQVRNDKSITFQTSPQPSFNKQFDLLIQNLNENTADGIENYLLCAN